MDNINNKRKSRLYKTVGGCLLLLSFIIQNYVHDLWDSKLKQRQVVIDNYYNNYTTSLLHLNAYLSSANNPEKMESVEDSLGFKMDSLGTLKSSLFMTQAARSLVMAFSDDINIDSVDPHIMSEMYETEMQRAREAKNLTNYFSLYTDIGTFHLHIQEYLAKKNREIFRKKETARSGFLGAYVLGSIILLIGFKYE